MESQRAQPEDQDRDPLQVLGISGDGWQAAQQFLPGRFLVPAAWSGAFLMSASQGEKRNNVAEAEAANPGLETLSRLLDDFQLG